MNRVGEAMQGFADPFLFEEDLVTAIAVSVFTGACFAALPIGVAVPCCARRAYGVPQA